MRRLKFWSFVGDSGIALVTVIGGVIVLLLQIVDPPWFRIDTILATILGLLVLLATSEVVERARAIGRIEERLETILSADLGQYDLLLVGRREIYAYWDRRVETLEKRLDSIRLNPREPYSPSAKHTYRNRLPKIAAQRNITRRYIVVFHDLADLQRIERDLSRYPPGTYYVGYFERAQVPIPMITFSIADGKDVTFGGYHTPYDAPGEQFNILSKRPDTVLLFQNYFELLWLKCTKLVDSKGIRQDLIDDLRSRLPATNVHGE